MNKLTPQLVYLTDNLYSQCYTLIFHIQAWGISYCSFPTRFFPAPRQMKSINLSPCLSCIYNNMCNAKSRGVYWQKKKGNEKHKLNGDTLLKDVCVLYSFTLCKQFTQIPIVFSHIYSLPQRILFTFVTLI